MSNELTVNASIAYSDADGAADSLALVNFLKTIATRVLAHIKVSVAITEQALSLAGIASPGYILIINRDSTNFCEVRTGTGSTKFARIDPGGCALFRFGSGVTAPYIIADTGAVLIEYMLLSN